MPLFGLLLLSAALSAPVGQPSPTASHKMALESETSATVLQPSELQPSQLAAVDQNAVSPSEDVCYKIRAYIFRRDDDHVPQFVRSTTCGPRKPHTKDAAWPKARLV